MTDQHVPPWLRGRKPPPGLLGWLKWVGPKTASSVAEAAASPVAPIPVRVAPIPVRVDRGVLEMVRRADARDERGSRSQRMDQNVFDGLVWLVHRELDRGTGPRILVAAGAPEWLVKLICHARGRVAGGAG